MKVLEFLDKANIKYEVRQHQPAFTAQHMAAAEHEPGRYVAKPVIIKADGQMMMCVLPADRKVNLRSLKEQLGAQTVELASEEEIGQVCGDCELGAEAPIGKLYNMPTIIDKSLEDKDHIVFQAGTHDKSVRLSMADYRKLVDAKVLDFSLGSGG